MFLVEVVQHIPLHVVAAIGAVVLIFEQVAVPIGPRPAQDEPVAEVGKVDAVVGEVHQSSQRMVRVSTGVVVGVWVTVTPGIWRSI